MNSRGFAITSAPPALRLRSAAPSAHLCQRACARSSCASGYASGEPSGPSLPCAHQPGSQASGPSRVREPLVATVTAPLPTITDHDRPPFLPLLDPLKAFQRPQRRPALPLGGCAQNSDLDSPRLEADSLSAPLVPRFSIPALTFCIHRSAIK